MKSATLSAVTIAVPVSMFGSTATPLIASSAAWAPIDPILSGNWATDPSSVPAAIAANSSGPASKPTTSADDPASATASRAPMIGGPHAP